MLYLADYLGTDFGWFHRKITSICLHWKCNYKKLSLKNWLKGRVVFAWKTEKLFVRPSFLGLDFVVTVK